MLRREHFPKSEYHDAGAPEEILRQREFSEREEVLRSGEQLDAKNEFNDDAHVGLASRKEYEAGDEEKGGPAAGHPLLHGFLTGLAIALAGVLVFTAGTLAGPKKDNGPAAPSGTAAAPETLEPTEKPTENPAETETEKPTETETEKSPETESEKPSETETVHVHALTKVEAVEASCTEDGNEACFRCDGCGLYFSDEEGKNEIDGPPVLSAPGHDYQDTVTAADCTEQGHTTHTCSRCGDTYEDTYTAALGHAPGAVTRENETAAACTAAGGYDEVTHCTRCGAELSRNHMTIAALGHDYRASVTAATCTAQGYTTHTCSRCNDSYTDSYTAALGHDFPIGPASTTGPTLCTRCSEPALTFTFNEANQVISYTIHPEFYEALTNGGYYGNFYATNDGEAGRDDLSENEYWMPEYGRTTGIIAIPSGRPGQYASATVLFVYSNGSPVAYQARAPYQSIRVRN